LLSRLTEEYGLRVLENWEVEGGQYLDLRWTKQEVAEKTALMRTYIRYSSSNIMWAMKSWRMKWEGQVARMWEIRNSNKISRET
jgi:hypothetical protein